MVPDLFQLKKVGEGLPLLLKVFFWEEDFFCSKNRGEQSFFFYLSVLRYSIISNISYYMTEKCYTVYGGRTPPSRRKNPACCCTDCAVLRSSTTLSFCLKYVSIASKTEYKLLSFLCVNRTFVMDWFRNTRFFIRKQEISDFIKNLS